MSIFPKINALRDQRSGILGQVRDRVRGCPLHVGKKLMTEIDDLECNRPEVSEYNRKGFDPVLSWGCVTNINEEMCATAVDQLMSERGNVMDNIKGLRDQRDALNQEIHAKTIRPVLQSLKGTF